MSWQAYVDTSLVGSGDVDKGAIFNAEGTSVWATSPNFTISTAEIKQLISAFKDTKDTKDIQSNGLHIAGTKYVVIKADDASVYGKKGKTGVVIVKTKLAILVTHYPDTVQPGVAANTVEKLGVYLRSVGY